MEQLKTSNHVSRKDIFINLHWKIVHFILDRPTAWGVSSYGFAVTNFKGWTLDIYIGKRVIVIRILDKEI